MWSTRLDHFNHTRPGVANTNHLQMARGVWLSLDSQVDSPPWQRTIAAR